MTSSTGLMTRLSSRMTTSEAFLIKRERTTGSGTQRGDDLCYYLCIMLTGLCRSMQRQCHSIAPSSQSCDLTWVYNTQETATSFVWPPSACWVCCCLAFSVWHSLSRWLWFYASAEAKVVRSVEPLFGVAVESV